MNELYIKFIAAVAPAIVLAILMTRRDKVRPEPIVAITNWRSIR